MKTLLFILMLVVPGICQAGTLKDEYELKKKCGEEASLYFDSNGNGKKDNKDVVTIVSVFKNHYNKKLNACYILTETTKRITDIGIVEEKHLHNLHENDQIAFFSFFKDKDYIAMCKIQDRECKTEKEFDKFVRPYMTQ
jgi:hypothetical protein